MKDHENETKKHEKKEKTLLSALIGFILLALLIVYALMATGSDGQPSSNPIDFLKKSTSFNKQKDEVKNQTRIVVRGKNNRRIFVRKEPVTLEVLVHSDNQPVASVDVPIEYPEGVSYVSNENVTKGFKLLDSLKEDQRQVYVGLISDESSEEQSFSNKVVFDIMFTIPDGVRTLYTFTPDFKAVGETSDSNIIVKSEDALMDILQATAGVDILIGNSVDLTLNQEVTLEDSNVNVELLALEDKNCTVDGCDQHVQLLIDGKTKIDETFTKGTIEYKEFEVLTESGQSIVLSISPQDVEGGLLTAYYYQGSKN